MLVYGVDQLGHGNAYRLTETRRQINDVLLFGKPDVKLKERRQLLVRQRVYADTSVIGGCLDDEFAEWSNALLKKFREGAKIAVISNLTREELERAPEEVRSILTMFPDDFIADVFLGREAEALADLYIEEKVVAPKHIVDARHIAIATIERVDVLASWNFKEIVNLSRIRAFNAVNLKMGYPLLEIRSPREVLYEKEV